MTQNINRRLWYCQQITNMVAMHPERIVPFITIVCDELSIHDLNAVYNHTMLMHQSPPTKAIQKVMEN